MLLIPFHHATRIHWPRWRRATALLVLGAIALAGPYVAASGTLTPRPGPARVLGLEPRSPAFALEREAPMDPDQSTFETYRLAAARMVEVLLANVPLALIAAAILGVATARGGATPSRTWLFLAVLLAASTLALVRLHATAGYCSPRNALVPGMILMLVAARGIDRLMTRLTIPGRLVGLPRERLRPGPVVWAGVLALVAIGPRLREPAIETPGPFNVYWDAGRWLARSASEGEVLDLTDWSLYFSRLPGSTFAHVREAAHSDVRWVVALASQVEGRSNYSDALHALIGGREPVAALPAEPKPGQVQVRIFDREAVPAAVADAGSAEAPANTARR